jgi:hypothetical protein
MCLCLNCGCLQLFTAAAHVVCSVQSGVAGQLYITIWPAWVRGCACNGFLMILPVPGGCPRERGAQNSLTTSADAASDGVTAICPGVGVGAVQQLNNFSMRDLSAPQSLCVRLQVVMLLCIRARSGAA